MNSCLVDRLREFMENEARSCSMDFGCITPMYVYRMMGGEFSLKEIESALIIARERLRLLMKRFSLLDNEIYIITVYMDCIMQPDNFST